MKKNWGNQDEVASTISEILNQGDNCIIAVDFLFGHVKAVIPVCLNHRGECMNFKEIKETINQVGCEPRKLPKQPLPRVFDANSILIFDKIA